MMSTQETTVSVPKVVADVLRDVNDYHIILPARISAQKALIRQKWEPFVPAMAKAQAEQKAAKAVFSSLTEVNSGDEWKAAALALRAKASTIEALKDERESVVVAERAAIKATKTTMKEIHNRIVSTMLQEAVHSLLQ
jgi:hypothetical protein